MVLKQEVSALDVVVSGTVYRRSNDDRECEVNIYYLTHDQDTKRMTLTTRYDVASHELTLKV